MAWLHTWAALVPGWLLFFIFVTGTLGYVNYEIDRWMTPERPLAVSAPPPPNEALDLAISHIDRVAPNAASWRLEFGGSRVMPFAMLQWRTDKDGQRSPRQGSEHRLLDPETHAWIMDTARETGGGQTLYQMHWRLAYMPQEWAIRLVGVATMFMFVALLTGIITHKKIFSDFFTFRPRKGQRSWLDAHNLASVSALPFFLMITYSGFILFLVDYMPAPIDAVYGADRRGFFYEQAFGNSRPARGEPDGPGEMAPLQPMLSEAERRWGSDAVGSIVVQNPGRQDSRVVIESREGTDLLQGRRHLRFNGLSGALLEEDRPISAANDTRRSMVGLHEGLFAGPLLRLLYVLSGALGSAMIATGLILWTVKRRKKQEKTGKLHFGFRLAETINIATVAGLPIAIAAYFWANRLLPADMAGRGNWEVHCLFITWIAALLWASMRSPGKAWVEFFGAAAIMWGLLPLLNLTTTNIHLGVTIHAGDWPLAGVDLSAFLAAGLFLLLAVKVRRKWASVQAPEQQRRGARRRAPEGSPC